MTSPVWLGASLLIAAAISFSSAGFFTRLVPTDPWTMLFWRGLFAGAFLAGVVALQQRGRTVQAFRDIGVEGLVVAICSAIATVCFLNALRLTSVADVLVIDAAAPFLTAGIAWLLIGERESRRTLFASLAAVVGVAIMAGTALKEGRLLGDLLALAMVTLMSIVMVLIRRKRGVNMVPAVCLSAFLCSLIVSPFARPESVGSLELGLLALFGVGQFGLGQLLLALGTPLVTATRGALIGVLQTPLGTLWVWLAFGETLATATLIGGMIVLSAVVADVLLPRNGRVAARAVDGPLTKR
jgi:drug/metabolite transporter (DMT)-like permease